MADATVDQVRRYILDGSNDDLRRLLSLSESFAEHARRALGRVGVGHGWTVIECGCGPIGGLALLAEMVGPSGRVVGVDFSESAIQRARSVMAALGLEIAEADGFFATQDPELGFEIHASTLAAVKERAVKAGFAAEMIDDLIARLRAAKAGGYDWVTSPFLLDLVLRKPKAM